MRSMRTKLNKLDSETKQELSRGNRAGLRQRTLCAEEEEEVTSRMSHQRSLKDVILIYARSSL